MLELLKPDSVNILATDTWDARRDYVRVRVAGSPRAAVCLTWARSHGLAAGDRVRVARELARACEGET